MAKIQIKSEKLTLFGGFFRVMEQFDSNKIEGINLIRTNYEDPLPGIRVTPDATEANRLAKISPDWHKRVCNQTCLHPNMFDCKHIMPEMCCRKAE